MALAVDGSWVARASVDGRLWVWQLRGSSLLSSRLAAPGLYGYPAVHPSGDRVLLGSEAGPVHLFSMVGREDRALEGFSSMAMCSAFSPDGLLAAAGGGATSTAEGVIRIWSLETGEARVLDALPRELFGGVAFPSSRALISAGSSGVRLWNLEDDTFRWLRQWESVNYGVVALSGDRQRMLSLGLDVTGSSGTPLVLHELERGGERVLEAFGENLAAAALDERGELAATGAWQGEVRVGPLSGGQPHLLLGHESLIFSVAFTPDGRQIVSADVEGNIRVWPLPDGRPFHTLPYEELLDRLRALTNYRVIEDDASATGYSLEAEPSRGWETVPTW